MSSRTNSMAGKNACPIFETRSNARPLAVIRRSRLRPVAQAIRETARGEVLIPGGDGVILINAVVEVQAFQSLAEWIEDPIVRDAELGVPAAFGLFVVGFVAGADAFNDQRGRNQDARCAGIFMARRQRGLLLANFLGGREKHGVGAGNANVIDNDIDFRGETSGFQSYMGSDNINQALQGLTTYIISWRHCGQHSFDDFMAAAKPLPLDVGFI